MVVGFFEILYILNVEWSEIEETTTKEAVDGIFSAIFDISERCADPTT